MITKPAFVLVILFVAIGLMGSGHGQNLGKTFTADGNSDENSPIISPLGPTSLPNGSAYVSHASLGSSAYTQELGGMELTLQQYRAGIENLSLMQVRQVWPGLDRHREAALKEAFQYLRSMSARPRMGLECVAPAMIDESTKLQCRESLTYNDAKGKPQYVKPTRVSILLSKQGENWTIGTMK